MLYAITDSGLMPGPKLIEKSEAALKGGCRWLQYRDKSEDAAKRLTEAQKLKALCDQYDAKLLINDDLELALAVDAHGLHLGQEDGSLSKAREALGENAILGITCHDQLHLARQGLGYGASYIAFGRFFPSKTKPNAKAAPLTLLAQAKALGVPVIAIGGITLENASQIFDAGASAIAVCHSLFACDDVEQRARDFCRLFDA